MLLFWCFMSMYRTAKQRPCPKAAPLGTGSKNRETVDPTLTSTMMIPGPTAEDIELEYKVTTESDAQAGSAAESNTVPAAGIIWFPEDADNDAVMAQKTY
jgi:hypothetical protein